MKRIICVCLLAFLAISSSPMTSYAQGSNHRHASEQEQILDQLVLGLFRKRIQHAVVEHYKDNSVDFQYTYDAVNADQTEIGHVLKSPFVVKFTIIPVKRVKDHKKQLGIDTITFGVAPGLFKGKETEVEILGYEHNEPKGN